MVSDLTTTTSDDSAAGLRPIGAVARELDLTPRAIRYYEEYGLLRPAIRIKGANRLYDESDVERLRKIKLLREVIGFSLAEIADLLDTEDMRNQLRSEFQGTTDPRVRRRVIQDALALAQRRLAIVERKLGQLEALRAEERERIARLEELLGEDDDGDGTEGKDDGGTGDTTTTDGD
jgi:DNA-binding transcriptional MerR regulator